MYQNDPAKVLTNEVRLSYCNLIDPRAPKQGGVAKYSVVLLIPKTDTVTKADIDASMQAAAQEAVAKKWDGKRPPQLHIPIHDGDGVRQSGDPYGPECKGHWVMTASSKIKPQVVYYSTTENIYVQLTSDNDIYGGMYARVTIRFYGYANSGNKGIGCGLGNVLKIRDAEHFAANYTSASDDFEGVGNSVVAPPQANNPAPFMWNAPSPPYSAYPPYQPAGAYPPVNINPLTGQPL